MNKKVKESWPLLGKGFVKGEGAWVSPKLGLTYMACSFNQCIGLNLKVGINRLSPVLYNSWSICWSLLSTSTAYIFFSKASYQCDYKCVNQWVMKLICKFLVIWQKVKPLGSGESLSSRWGPAQRPRAVSPCLQSPGARPAQKRGGVKIRLESPGVYFWLLRCEAMGEGINIVWGRS